MAAKKRKPVIDWWAFEYALAAGRRWKQIVKERKESRIAFALGHTHIDWIKQKRDDYATFKDLRMREGKWEKVEQAVDQEPTINGKTDTNSQNATNGEHAIKESPDANEERQHKKNREHNADFEIGDYQQAETEGEREEGRRTKDEERERNGEDLATGELGADGKPLPTSTGSSETGTIPPTRSHPALKVRPSWATRTNTAKLEPHECIEYDEKIRSNLRERLGEEGWFSYKLLGECYIHGLMDGEAMLYQNEGDDMIVPSMVFEIR
jgi:hypothetical protein